MRIEGFLQLVSVDIGTILFTLLNTAIILFLYKRLFHDKVTAMLDKRKEVISANLKSAEDAKTSALEKEEEYKALLADSKAEAEKIVNAATTRALAKEREIISEANQNAVLIREKAEESIELEKKRVTNEIKNQISELVIVAAASVAEKEIDEKDNETLINSFLVNV